jgi:protein-tyrosine kinase
MRGGGRREPYRLATLLYPRSSKAEGYRTLRSNIEFSALDAPIRSLLVTSAVPGEGKTVTAANLAVVFAQAGRRVLLVDANLRKPGVDAIFNLGNAQGLTTLIRGDETSLEAVAQETQVEHLQVVTTGPLPPNPAELLGSQRMHAILNQAKTEHDLVILDSPPLQVVTDAAILSSFTDGTLLVIDARHTRRAAIRQAREALAKADARVLGAVLNRLPDRKYSDDHDYYGRAYGLADATPDPGRRTEKSEAAP